MKLLGQKPSALPESPSTDDPYRQRATLADCMHAVADVARAVGIAVDGQRRSDLGALLLGQGFFRLHLAACVQWLISDPTLSETIQRFKGTVTVADFARARREVPLPQPPKTRQVDPVQEEQIRRIERGEAPPFTQIGPSEIMAKKAQQKRLEDGTKPSPRNTEAYRAEWRTHYSDAYIAAQQDRAREYLSKHNEG